MSVSYSLFQLDGDDLPNSWNLSNASGGGGGGTGEDEAGDGGGPGPGGPLNYPSLLLVLLIAWTFFGNMLVLIAVYRERGLKSMSNYVIASLALADLLLAVLVMPLGLVSLVSLETNASPFNIPCILVVGHPGTVCITE